MEQNIPIGGRASRYVAAASAPRKKKVPSHTVHEPTLHDLPNDGSINQSADVDDQGSSLERLIGGKLYAVVGGLIVVVGLAMFLKLAIDRGWFTLSPAMRCIGVACFGGVLLMGGEWLRKRTNTIAAASLTATGLAAIYAAGYAAFGLYHLVHPLIALGLLSATSALGVMLALRSRLMPLAALSILGAYLALIVLPSGVGVRTLGMGRIAARSGIWGEGIDSVNWVTPMYMLGILGFGLWLSAARPDPFRRLRSLVIAATGFFGGILAVCQGLGFHDDLANAGTAALAARPALDAVIPLAFLFIAWLMVHIELVFGAKRLAAADGALREDGPREGQNADAFSLRSVMPVVWSFAAAIWWIGTSVTIIRSPRCAVTIETWIAPVVGAAAALTVACLLTPVVRLLRGVRGKTEETGGTIAALRTATAASDNASPLPRDSARLPRSDTERLGVAMLMQTWALVIVAVAFAFAGWAEVVAWLALGLAAAMAGAWMRSRALIIACLIPLCIAVSRLLTYDFYHLSMLAGEHTGIRLLGLHLTRWSALMALAGASWVIVGLLLRRGVPRSSMDRDAPIPAHEFIAPPMPGTVGDVGADTRVLPVSIGGSSPRGESRRELLRDLGGAIVGIGVGLIGIGAISPESAASSLAIAGMVVAVALMTIGRSMQNLLVVARAYALLAGITLAVVVASLSVETPHPNDPGATFITGLYTTRWTLPMGVATAVWAALAWLGVRRAHAHTYDQQSATADGRAAAIVAENAWIAGRCCASFAIGLLFLIVITPLAHMSTVCAIWTLLALAIGLAHRLKSLRPLGLHVLATVGMFAPLGLWLVTFPRERWALPQHSADTETALSSADATGVGLHALGAAMNTPAVLAALLVGAMTALAWGWSRWARRVSQLEDGQRGLVAQMRPYAVILATAALALGFIASTVEIRAAAYSLLDDPAARLAAVSIWWGIFAAGLLACGFARRIPAVRHAGLALLGIAAAKAVAVDLAGVDSGWRIASFIGLGMLMLGVAVTYARITSPQRFKPVA